MQCLKCGQIGHRAANCPKKDENHGQAKMTDEGDVEQAPFVCYAELALSASTETAAMTTAEAVKRGWCVVDGGATKTIGSITAVQNVLDRNKQDSGDSRLRHVDTKRQPVFSFGNSSENKCASTVELAIQAAEKEGTMTIHTLDTGAGPILMSVSTLRSLGAVIDPTPQRAETNMSIATMKKAQLQELLSQMGEDPPNRWTKVELRQRIVELDPELAQHQRGQDRDTELRGLIRKINQASKKKQTMVALCEGELQLALTGNETLAQLERRAVEQAHRLARAHAQDYVGFGKHSGLQYEDINHYQPSYRAWVLQTAQENPGADYRLVRLANWLRNNPPALEADSPVRTARPKAKMMMKPKTTMKSPPPTTIDEDAATSSDGPPIRADQLAKVLTQLSGAIETLQHEMKDLKEEKEERPRKKDAKNMGRVAASDTTSEGYTKVDKLEEESRNIVPGLFQALVSYDRLGRSCPKTFLVEWGRFEHGVVVPTVRTFLPATAYQQPDGSRLVRKGWKLITSHGRYTKSFASRVAKALALELTSFNKPKPGLNNFSKPKTGAQRPGQLGSDKVKYFVFGAYAHGAQYGITNRTNQFPKCVQYLNMYMKQKTNNSRKWTSLVVNVNNSMPLHRDVNNQEVSGSKRRRKESD
ncbi:unnamed protein product [Symbiodinium necroappetens]|uniref:CCHC-type domain-containing protein n=1 Tax=Symbiodinium necroappetens TaxID=1628268 RepID=A0A813AJ21_9DINO|nr:unnamed protein product [Symbiodinium necroappetens]